MAGGAVGNAKQVNRGNRQQPQGFKQHSRLRFHGDFLTHQTVKRKAERQTEGDNRQRAEGPQLYQYAAEGQNHRHPLHPTEALAEENHPQQNIHQRVNKVAQARFEHVMVIHRPDKQQPVSTNQHRRECEQEDLFRGFQQRFDAGPLTADAHQRNHEEKRPDNAVSEDLVRRYIGDKLEVRWRDTPNKISGKGE